VVNSDPQGALANPSLLGHLLVVRDLVVTLVKVIVEDQVAFRFRQHLEAFLEAFLLFT
jgi:hypothetical protein